MFELFSVAPFWFTAVFVIVSLAIVGNITFDNVGWASVFAFLLILFYVFIGAFVQHGSVSAFMTIPFLLGALVFLADWMIIGAVVAVIKWYFYASKAGDVVREALVDVRKKRKGYVEGGSVEVSPGYFDKYQRIVPGIDLQYFGETDTAKPVYSKSAITALFVEWIVFWPAYLLSFFLKDILEAVIRFFLSGLTRLSTYAMGDALK